MTTLKFFFKPESDNVEIFFQTSNMHESEKQLFLSLVDVLELNFVVHFCLFAKLQLSLC